MDLPMPVRHPARVRLIILGIVVFAVASSWHHLLGDAPFGSLTEPVWVEIGGLQAGDRDRIEVSFRPPRADETATDLRNIESLGFPHEGFRWEIGFRPVAELHITASAQVMKRIASVTVRIGEDRHVF